MKHLLFVACVAFGDGFLFGFLTTSHGRCIRAHYFHQQLSSQCNLNVANRRESTLRAEKDVAGGEDEDFDYMQITTREDMVMQFLSGSSWTLPNTFEMFLNQCTIQSFLFLVKSLRDPLTVMWLEEFTQPDARVTETPKPPFPQEENPESFSSKLLVYHGLAALNTTRFPTWNSYFVQLLEQPVQSYVVESDLPHVPDYHLDIEPVRLCSRIISVREQIAREFVNDLDAITSMGSRMLDSYWEDVRSPAAMDKDDRAAQVARERRQQNFLFLELNPDEESDYQPSPLRKGNFDLLCNLVTQESIHRILNNQPGNHYLRRFYVDRIHYFVGNQQYGRADSFLKELLLDVPTFEDASEGSISLTDPTSLAETILKMRENVVREWKSLAAAAPDKHMVIRRLQLDLVFGRATSEADDTQNMQ